MSHINESSDKALRYESPRMLDSLELYELIRGDTEPSGDFPIWRQSYSEVFRYVSENIIGACINGVNVLFIDFVHDQSVDPILRRVINSGNTTVVVAEYFYPELVESLSPLAMAFANGIKTGEAYRDRIQYARKLAEVCADAQKPVAVADIAYRFGYMLNRGILRATGSIAALFPPLPISICLLLANTAWSINLIRQFAKGEGIFDRDEISSLDRFVVDFEQARRLYTACGLNLLTQQYSPQDFPGRKHPMIIVNYPKAHSIRILDTIINKKPILDRGKNIIYRLFGLNLDFSLRIWEYKGSVFDGTTENPSPYRPEDRTSPKGFSRWWRISHQPLSLP